MKKPIRTRATVSMVPICRRAFSGSLTLVSVILAISVRPRIDNEAGWSNDILPGLGRQVGCFVQVENSADQTLLISPLLGQFPARKQIAVGAPLLIDVLARGHEVLVWPEENRTVLVRTAAREMQHDRSSVGRAWAHRPAGSTRNSEDAQDVVRAPGPEAAPIEFDLGSVSRHTQ